jgi:hypothetical protein
MQRPRPPFEVSHCGYDLDSDLNLSPPGQVQFHPPSANSILLQLDNAVLAGMSSAWPGRKQRATAGTASGRRRSADTKWIIGPKLRARLLPAQQGEVAIAAAALNRMIRGCQADFRPRRLTQPA